MEIIEYVKSMIKAAGKKFYVIVVGKLNVPKLSNFPEIGILNDLKKKREKIEIFKKFYFIYTKSFF